MHMLLHTHAQGYVGMPTHHCSEHTKAYLVVLGSWSSHDVAE